LPAALRRETALCDTRFIVGEDSTEIRLKSSRNSGRSCVGMLCSEETDLDD
jgi:hypothetical protein